MFLAFEPFTFFQYMNEMNWEFAKKKKLEIYILVLISIVINIFEYIILILIIISSNLNNPIGQFTK